MLDALSESTGNDSLVNQCLYAPSIYFVHDHSPSSGMSPSSPFCGDDVECVGDVTGDMIVDVNDLLTLLGAFGQTGDMLSDITNDLVVDVNDLLMLLGEFGKSC